MTLNIDPGTITIGIFIFAWIVRVDRKITKLETWIRSCKYCRDSLDLKTNDKSKS